VHASIAARDIVVSYGRVTVLDGLQLNVDPGQRIGLVAPNGCGKSTLLRVLTGQLPPERGSVQYTPPNATVGLLAQEPERVSGETVRNALTRRTGVRAANNALDASTDELATGVTGADDRYAAALERWLDLGGADLDARIGATWAELGLAPRLLDADMQALSGGEAARVSLAAILLSRFDVLLLDEPTNDLDLPSLQRLEQFVVSQRVGVVLVSHDRAFLERTITHVAELDARTRRITMYAGGWQSYVDERSLAARHAQEAYDVSESKRGTIVARGQREREWATQGVAKAKRAVKDGKEVDKHIKNFRMQGSEQLAARARRTEKMLERLPDVDEPWKPWELRFTIAEAPRAGAVALLPATNSASARSASRLPVESGLQFWVTTVPGSQHCSLRCWAVPP
jgi:ATPase subunit of ABC transporter with duplicated ATPase domains